MNDWLTGFWYAVAREEELIPGSHIKVTALGQRLILFLDATGAPAALHDLCPHMGAPLSLGKVCDGQIRCRYHDFAFGGNGQCTSMPGTAENHIPCAAMATDAYPTTIRYGLVWVFLGRQKESERPPLIEIPEFSDPAFIRSVTSQMRWNGAARSWLENLLDFSHFPTIHGASFGCPAHHVTQPYPMQIVGKYEVAAQVIVKLKPGNGIFPDVPALGPDPDYGFHSRYYAPSVVVNSFLLGPFQNTTLWTFTPIDEQTVLVHSVGVRNYESGSGTDQALAALGKQIYEEDQAVVEACLPELLPVLVPAVPVDRYLLACRNIYNGLIPTHGLQRRHMFRVHGGLTLTVIPSPMRDSNSALDHGWERRSEQELRQKEGRAHEELS